MRNLVVAVWVMLVVAGKVVPSWAFTCPVVIKQAEELVKRAEAAKLSPEARSLLDEAKKQLAEARAHHAKATTKRDHGDAVRKAKVASAFAEEAILLQNP